MIGYKYEKQSVTINEQILERVIDVLFFFGKKKERFICSILFQIF